MQGTLSLQRVLGSDMYQSSCTNLVGFSDPFCCYRAAAVPDWCPAGGIVDGVVSGAVLGLLWRGAVVVADKTGLKEQVEKARDKLRK